MTRKTWNITIKAGLFVLFTAMLAWQIRNRLHVADIWGEFLAQVSDGRVILVVLVLLLMPVNWLLETIKWRLFLPDEYKIPFRVCLKSVLAGVTLSLLTPNRIGEYGGRVLFIGDGRRWDAAIATMAGSFAQNLVQIAAGSVGFFIFYILEGLSSQASSGWWMVILLIGIMLLAFAYFRMDLLYTWTRKLRFPKFLERGKAHLKLLKAYSEKKLLYGLLLALLRYGIFCVQFVLALRFFGVDVPLYWTFWGVTVIYLFHSGVPLPPFIDIMARSQIALLIWQQFEPNELSVISASFSIWIINLVIPAVLGLVAIENVNVMKTLGYAREK